MSRRFCVECRYGNHQRCVGDVYDPTTERLEWCGCEPTHEYSYPDQPLPDPYHQDAAEDAYLDSLIGERWGGEQP